MAAAAGGAAAYATHWYIVDRGLSDEPAPPALCGWDRVDGYGRREIAIADTATMRLAGRDAAANPNNQIAAANSLCGLGRANRVDCAVVPQPGKHDWPFADQAFAAALP